MSERVAHHQMRGRPQTQRGRARAAHDALFASDHIETRQGGRFRWLLSTCLAATIGAIAIFVAIFGSADDTDHAKGFLPALKDMGDGGPPPTMASILRRSDGLVWAVPKTDRLEVTSGAFSTRYTIHDTHKQRRGGREYLQAKPYVRIVANLAPVPSNYADVIPPFNPFLLYADKKPVGATDDQGEQEDQSIKVKVVELLGGIIPDEDGLELRTPEVEEIVRETIRDAAATQQQLDDFATTAARAPNDADLVFPNTTTLIKTSAEDMLSDDHEVEGSEVKTIKVSVGDTLEDLLKSVGADSWLAQTMLEALEGSAASDIKPDQVAQITVVPSLTSPGQFEPSKFSLFDVDQTPLVTVARNDAGEFVADFSPSSLASTLKASVQDGESKKDTAGSLYKSIYHAGLVQNIDSDVIMSVLRVHAYETDFRRRLAAGDQVELFFDQKIDAGIDGPPGELLYTAITAGGTTSKYYRFRTSDGKVDFYDEEGSNSRKFLMRRPVRGGNVRLTSGYGSRYHPLLNRRRMHTGVDWAAPRGTPILSAGNGVIEVAKRKGQYGKYIRIRHANGYQTAYGHLSRIAPGVVPGVKVRQGQVIGKVGSTGLSTGPHLHFEVLVNNRFVNPMSIQVPRERQLADKDLANFKKERARIEDLLRRPPVVTKTASR
jgi:murein DD-endopeptidase MepM/ murein hydrolase activator NlpD